MDTDNNVVKAGGDWVEGGNVDKGDIYNRANNKNK